MELFIISGRSGSGKTTALHVFEDLDFYCVDNLPCTLIPELLDQTEKEQTLEAAVVGIDARNLTQQLIQFPNIIDALKKRDITCTIIYLDADEKALLKRFSETRRKHPLSDTSTSLAEAIAKEKEILYPIASKADLSIDTTHLNLHQLRDLVISRISTQNRSRLSILLYSFGFKHGLPTDADMVFDVRCLPNPHWIAQLRQYTGLDKPVIDFLKEQDPVQKMIDDIATYLDYWLPKFEANNRSYMTIAIGCTGGQHRSVFIAETLCAHVRQHFSSTQVRHQQIPNPVGSDSD